MELYNAALLPNLKADSIKQEVEALTRRKYEIENEEEIDRIERLAKERLEVMKAQPRVIKRIEAKPKTRKHRRI